MNEDLQPTDQALSRAVEIIANAQWIEEIEPVISAHPSLASPEFLDRLDHQIDEIELKGGGDWWGLTRARVLLDGYRHGTLKDALFRCLTRDLLPLGPDDVRRHAEEHPELLGERADQLLRHWAAQDRAAGQGTRAVQIELRHGRLREIAFDRAQALVAVTQEQEREFQRSGDLTTLDQTLASRKYLFQDPDAPFVSVEYRIANVQAISRLLQARFRVAGALQDLTEALTETEKGIAALPEGHPVRQALLAELGAALNLRFRELRLRDDIDRAILIFDSLASQPQLAGPDPESPQIVRVNVAVALLDRYYEFKLSGDLNRSIDILRQVVNATPFESARRPLRMNNLGSALYLAFRDHGDLAALKEAITLQREVAEVKDASFQVHALAALARSLDAAAQIGDNDAEESTAIFRQACQVGLQMNVGAAMWAGMTWGRAAWDRSDWAAAAEAYGYCVDGARLLINRQGTESGGNQEIRLSQFREVAPRAALALARVGRVADAAVVFELARAQLLIQAIERGGRLRKAPDLDAEIAPGISTGAAPVRYIPDLDKIIAAAGGRSLLYLVCTDRGGLALLVRHRKVTAVSLPKLDERTLAEQVGAYLTGLASPEMAVKTSALDTATQWLWEAVMGPVLEQIDRADEIVLVPGGLLGLLPVHAAWTPDEARPGKRRYAMDMATFSYAPSARSLGIARARAANPIDSEMIGKVLIVADPEPVNAHPLKFAAAEADLVRWHLPQATVLRGSGASLPQVSDWLAGADLVHFVCHGFADFDTPLESGVVLAGNKTLSVRKIRDMQVTARLAVLSACETGVAGTALPDEVVAIPTGLLQAGVAGVVASLWPVSDWATTILMAEFYRRLCRERLAPAAALRGAQQWMRDTTDAQKADSWEAGAGDWLPTEIAQRLRSSLDEMEDETEWAYPWWWATFMYVGS